MKKKIGEIYNKPIVTGDKNLVTKNEIHESTLKGGGTVDSGSSDVEYWKVNIQWAYGDLIGVLYKNVTSDGVTIQKYPDENGNKVKAIVFIPTYMEFDNYATLYVSFKDVIKTMFGGVVTPEFETQFATLFTPITKEEFYDLNNSNDSGESTVKEGDLIYYTLNDSFTSIGNITDNITQIAVSRGESMSSGNVGNLNRFVDIQEVTINKEDDYVSISIPNFIVVDMPAFVYKVGSDLKTAEDIIGNSSITRITKEEYDNIFNM